MKEVSRDSRRGRPTVPALPIPLTACPPPPPTPVTTPVTTPAGPSSTREPHPPAPSRHARVPWRAELSSAPRACWTQGQLPGVWNAEVWGIRAGCTLGEGLQVSPWGPSLPRPDTHTRAHTCSLPHQPPHPVSAASRLSDQRPSVGRQWGEGAQAGPVLRTEWPCPGGLRPGLPTLCEAHFSAT